MGVKQGPGWWEGLGWAGLGRAGLGWLGGKDRGEGGVTLGPEEQHSQALGRQ